MTMFANPAFVAKYQRLECNPPLVVKSLHSFTIIQEESANKVCPVCLLLYYLNHTQARHGNCFCLLLP